MSQPNVSGQVPATFRPASDEPDAPAEPGLPPEVRAALDKGQVVQEAPEPDKPEEELSLPERIDFGDGQFVRFWPPEELESGDIRPALRGMELEGRVGWCHGIARGAIREWNLTAKKTGLPLPLPKDDPDSMDRLSAGKYVKITNVLLLYVDLMVPEDPPVA